MPQITHSPGSTKRATRPRRPPLPLVPALRREARPEGRSRSVSLFHASLLVSDLAGIAIAIAVATTRGLTVGLASAYACTALLALLLVGAYRPRLEAGPLDSAAAGARAAVLAAMAMIATLVVVEPAAWWRDAVLLLAAASLVTIPALRHAVVLGHRAARRRGHGAEPVVIVGTGRVARQIARRLAEHPNYGLRAAGFVDSDPFPLAEATGDLPPFLGGPTGLDEALATTGARKVILTFSQLSDHGMLALVRQCERQGVEVSVIPRFFDAMHERVSIDHIGGLPVMRVPPLAAGRTQFLVKHAFDRLVAAALLVLVAPLFLALAAAVRLGSPGPVFFRQRRVGRDGCVFDVLKFRSMRPLTDREARFTLREGRAPGGVEGVDRRTRIGKLMRRTSLDELPQLLNVLRGEMSLVGPRPERPEFVALFDREVRRYGERHRVKAGVTGWAQVNGLRGQTSIAKRVEWDNFYIQNFSLWLDVRILLMTFLAVFRTPEGEG
jgi:exopolysaccharide biosynthesis polyprenyl glycosylphosphotransferase